MPASIGLFDSGLGGLGVLAAVRAHAPHTPLLYLADQQYAPYGERSLEAVRARAFAAARFLIARGAALVAVACNTASAAALHALRAEFPDTPFVGMEPAVKPAAADTASGAIGVIATRATFQSTLFAGVVARFAQGVAVVTAACPEIVDAVEAGRADAPELATMLRERFAPMRAAGVDRLVLGCTHFPFARAAIVRAAGPGVALIDPAPAVARRVAAVWAGRHAPSPKAAPARPIIRYYTTGDAARFSALASRLTGTAVTAERATVENDA